MIKYFKCFPPLLLSIVLGGVSLFLLAMLMSYSPPQQEVPEVPVHAVEAYKNRWNLSISSCQEQYYAASDHTAFGEGTRYSVLIGSVALSDSILNHYGEQLTKIAGDSPDLDVYGFLSDVWMALEIPEEDRCAIAQCKWTVLASEDGSKILIAEEKDDDIVYIAEQIL